MNKKILGLCIVGLFTLTILSSIGATAGKTNVAEFEWWQFYSGWGPGAYYEQDVLVHYTAVNRWVLNKNEITPGWWYIEQALTQKGDAEVYDATTGDPFTDSWGTTGLKGDLMESGLNFRVNEVTQGYVDTDQTWYHRDHVDDLINWNYHWIIPGVYHYFASYHNGVWDSQVLFP